MQLEANMINEFIKKDDYQGKDKKKRYKEFQEINMHKMMETFLRAGAVVEAKEIQEMSGISEKRFNVTRIKILIEFNQLD